MYHYIDASECHKDVLIKAIRDIRPIGQPWLPLGLVDFAMYHGYGARYRATRLEKT
jgi:hypothetical protein